MAITSGEIFGVFWFQVKIILMISQYGCFYPKIMGKPPKMDGENKGSKPYEQMG